MHFEKRIENIFGHENEADGDMMYIVYNVVFGMWWDFTPPLRFDLLRTFLGYPTGCSWLLLSIVQEIGWSGSLYPGKP